LPKESTKAFTAFSIYLGAAARLCDKEAKPDGPTAIGYGGARGGGKSHWLLAQMGADDCQRVPG
jgi:phage terminase large subunit